MSSGQGGIPGFGGGNNPAGPSRNEGDRDTESPPPEQGQSATQPAAGSGAGDPNEIPEPHEIRRAAAWGSMHERVVNLVNRYDSNAVNQDPDYHRRLIAAAGAIIEFLESRVRLGAQQRGGLRGQIDELRSQLVQEQHLVAHNSQPATTQAFADASVRLIRESALAGGGSSAVAQNQELRNANEDLREANEDLRDELSRFRAQHQALRGQQQGLNARNAELERQLRRVLDLTGHDHQSLDEALEELEEGEERIDEEMRDASGSGRR